MGQQTFERKTNIYINKIEYANIDNKRLDKKVVFEKPKKQAS